MPTKPLRRHTKKSRPKELQAPIALSSSGQVLLNVNLLSREELLALRRRPGSSKPQRFVGIVLSRGEVKKVLRALDDGLAEAIGLLVGAARDKVQKPARR